MITLSQAKFWRGFTQAVCLASLLAICCTGCGSTVFYSDDPSLTSINIIDQNGVSETISNPERLKQYENVDFLAPQPYQKVMRVYARDESGDVRAFITSYHPNGQPKQSLEVVNGRAFGTYQEWHQNGTLKIKAQVIGGEADLNTGAEKTWLFEGYCKAWDENGRLEAEIPYSKGDLSGISYYYHPNGKIWKKVPCEKNRVEGVFETFLENGELFQTTSFNNGQKSGPSQRFWCGGTLAADEIYCDGKLQTGRYYDSSNKQISQVDGGKGFKAVFGKETITELQEYVAGVQEGVVKVFNTRGEVVKTYRVKNGFKNGEEVEYYEDPFSRQSPKPKMSISWVQGKIQGMVKTWYPDGVQESQREMSGNAKNGVLTAWYQDGSLMMIEQYDLDKLVKGEYYMRGDKTPLSYVRDGSGTVTLFDKDGTFIRKISYKQGKPEVD